MKQVIRLLLVLLVTVPLSLASFGLVPLHGTVANFGNVAAQVYNWVYFVPGLLILSMATMARSSSLRTQALTTIRNCLDSRKEAGKSYSGQLFARAFILSTIILLLACGYNLTAILMAAVVLVDVLMYGYAQSVYDKYTKARARALG